MTANLLSQDDDEVGLFFVIPLNMDKEDCDSDMKETFQASVDNELYPSWKTEESCLLLEPSKRNLFVFSKFEGAAFDHLKEFKCVINGPRCLNQCLMRKEPVPIVSQPCFTAAMNGLVITCSGGGIEVKNEIKKKVELMGGIYGKSFTEKTTHVVVSSVISSKYEKALELGIPVRTREWVDAVWRKSLKEYVRADDDTFDQYKCPPFLDLKVCSSGLTIKETEKLKNTVVKYGGTYDSALSQKINVLAVKHPKGEKFKHAKSWAIPCVEPRWIYDSVQNGHALPTNSYEIAGGRAASSPTCSNAPLNFSVNLSTVQFDQKTHIDETLNSTTSSVVSFCPALKATTPVKMPPPAPKRTPVKNTILSGPTPGELKHLLGELDLNLTKKAGSFLDGCGVFIVGWNADEDEILRKILKCSGAARFTDLNERVSHVLVGNLEKTFIRTLKNLSHKPHIVNIKWLIESVAEKCPAPEEPFYCMPSENLNVSEAPSPLSKKGMALLQRETFSPKKPLAVKQLPIQDGMSPNKGKRQLLAKYKSGDLSDVRTMSTSAISMPPPPPPHARPKVHPQSDETLRNDDSDVAGSQDMIFTGLNFVIVGLTESAASYVEQDLICKYGGSVVPKSFKGVPDYAVVPLTGATLRKTATEIITILWLESCIEEQSVLPVLYYHEPVVIDVNKKPLEGCVLGLSGYSGKERQFISELASALGAICQDVFAKRSKSNAKASSHLICKSSERSEKFNAAIKWRRPAVYHSWLLACAASGTQVPENEHLVDSSQEIKPLDSVNCSTASVSDSSAAQSKVEPPQVTALRQQPWFRTPDKTNVTYDEAEVDRILNYVPSPNPYEVKTPPVPLGLSDDPTPRESKRLQKWLDRLPENAPLPPSRRDSTPLHVLRKRILDAHSVTTPEMLHLVPFKDGDGVHDDDTLESAVAMKAQNVNLGSKHDSPHGSACSTPIQKNDIALSRKLFEAEGNELGTPIDGHLDKLNKLMATPEVNGEGSSLTSKTANVNFISAENPKNQVMYDTLKDGSQPYAIKWEDPVNMRRMAKDGYVSPLKHEDANTPEVVQSKRKTSRGSTGGEQSTTRKSTDNSVTGEPPLKRKSSESAENAPKLKRSHMEVEKTAPKLETSKKFPTFSLSHIDAKEPLVALIRKLGGTLLDTSNYNAEATHLLIDKPQRSEKLLGFIAAGKWVLHSSYLLQSEKQGYYVDEEDYEWGNPKQKFKCNLQPNSIEEALARAAYRWRTTIADDKSAGAFEGFKCKLLTPPEKKVAFSRLINAGGGQVLPENSTEKPSFCLLNMATHRGCLPEYAKLGVPCLSVTFLYDHLTIHPPPKPEERVSEDYKKLREEYVSKH